MKSNQQQLAAARRQLAQLRAALKQKVAPHESADTGKVESLRPDGITAVRRKIESTPLQARRTLSGQALASALKTLPR